MATKNDGKTVVKDINEVDFASGQPAEIVIDVPSDPDEVVYEGGPLDGQRGADAAEDDGLSARIEERRKAEGLEKKVEAAPADGEKVPAGGKEEETLPEVELDEKTGEAKQAEAAPGEAAAKVDGEPEYQPNLKYTVYDKEKEFPDWAKGLVTSKEGEDHIRDLLTRADGLDEMKESQRRIVGERNTAQQMVEEHIAKVNDLVKLRNTSLPLFFEKMGVPEQAVLQYAHARLQAMSDETGNGERQWQEGVRSQRTAWDSAQAQATEAQASGSAFRTLHEQAVTNTFAMPEVRSFEEAYDKSAGKPGSFKQAFSQMGDMIHRTERGRYAPPGEVVQRLMQQYSFVGSVPQQPAPAAPAPAPTPAQPVTAKPAAPASVARPKTIPRVGGNGVNASPTKQRLRSLDEVKAKVKAELDQ